MPWINYAPPPAPKHVCAVDRTTVYARRGDVWQCDECGQLWHYARLRMFNWGRLHWWSRWRYWGIVKLPKA